MWPVRRPGADWLRRSIRRPLLRCVPFTAIPNSNTIFVRGLFCLYAKLGQFRLDSSVHCWTWLATWRSSTCIVSRCSYNVISPPGWGPASAKCQHCAFQQLLVSPKFICFTIDAGTWYVPMHNWVNIIFLSFI